MANYLRFILFYLFSYSAFGLMHVNNPQLWWNEEAPATLENIEIEVRTIGIYSETTIAFDLMLADENYFYDEDLLEFTFDFKLNPASVVNDSWLWIHDYISLGEGY